MLDEADHMADLGFLPVVRRLLEATPADGQRMLFSATLDRDVNVLVRRFLTEATPALGRTRWLPRPPRWSTTCSLSCPRTGSASSPPWPAEPEPVADLHPDQTRRA